MRRVLILLLLTLLNGAHSFAQQYTLVYRTGATGIELKWYQQDLVSRKELFIMRRENGSDWKQLHTNALKAGAYKISPAELGADKELKDYVQMANSPQKAEGFGLLMMTLKSFQSVPFSQHLGIYYRDETAVPNMEYDYRLVERKGASWVELALLENISSAATNSQLPVDSLDFNTFKAGVSFRWKPEPNRFYGVNVYRSVTPDSLGKLITPDPVLLSNIEDAEGKTVLPERFFTDERLQEKQTYYYTFVGLNFFGDSLMPSAQLKVRIQDATAPIPPGEVSKQIFDKKVVLSWSQPEASEDMTGYHIYATAANDTILKQFTTDPLVPGTLRYEFEAGRYALYTLRVAAVDAEGNTGFSNEVYAETLDKIPPMAPVQVAIVADTARLIIQWQPNPEADIMGYKIYRSVKKDETALALLTSDHFPEAHYIDSLPVNAINAFSYKVIAIDSSGNESPLSVMATNMLIDITPPKAPFLKTVNLAGKQEVLLSWVGNTEADHAHYLVYRKNDSDSAAGFKQLNLEPVPRDVVQFTDRSADRKYTYSYYLRAVDERGNVSANSNVVRFRQAPEREANQLSVRITKGKYDKASGSIRLRWQSKPYSETARYMVFRKNAAGSFVPVSPMLETFSYTDTTVDKGAVAEYQVRIYEQGGQSRKSEIVQVKIPQNKNK